MGGRWSIAEAKHHINYLDLIAAFHALKCFAPIHSRIYLLKENSTLVGFISRMGGMASLSLIHFSRKLWVCCLEREIFVVAQHIPGSRIKAFQKMLLRSFFNPGLQELKNSTVNPGESGLAGVIDERVIFFKHL